MVSNFDLTKAAHAKQAAYGEMSEVQQKMAKLSEEITRRTTEIDERQAELDELKKRTDKEWENYNNTQLRMKAEIGDVITSIRECNVLEESFRSMSEAKEEESAKAYVYAKGADFFSKLASEKMIERDQLIANKRAVIRPDNSARTAQLLNNLKQLRKERAERLNDYHALKNELSLKKANFDRLKDRYEAIKNGSDDETEDYTFRPVILDNLENKGLLIKAGIPEEFHESCTIKRRSDNKIDIYYGKSYEAHGHVILDNDNVIYSREPA